MLPLYESPPEAFGDQELRYYLCLCFMCRCRISDYPSSPSRGRDSQSCQKVEENQKG